MAGLPQNVEELLTRLSENARGELELVRELAEAIRRTDDQLLKEVRSVSMLHEIRREAIFGELQHLASRLCALPSRDVMREPVPQIEETARPLDAIAPEATPLDPETVSRAGDWRMAAQRIDEELEQYFGGAGPHH